MQSPRICQPVFTNGIWHTKNKNISMTGVQFIIISNYHSLVKILYLKSPQKTVSCGF